MSDDENMPAVLETDPLANPESENNSQNAAVKDSKTAQVDQDENVDIENQKPQKFVSKTKLKVSIKEWAGVASWKWIANDDTCGICRVAFDGCCPDCRLPGDDCPLVWGACTHCFHIHCIMKWLNAQQAQHLCPMCRQDWKFKES